ncbi:MAG: undecaprenyl/decaprenyl-phosphate alpha-N-acetylglucosaminyl 1-phosphate transferase [Chloroflexi bacterium]|nr:undecaprenyl/decaprenyl-phosphate alpha-N-acetylglucosaminyl 1-phosphate transferase [Chloroflexota bacterium]
MVLQIILAVLLSVVISVAITPLCIWLAWRVNLIDRPGSEAHKIHKLPMPLAGGLIIFLVIVLGCAWAGILTLRPIAPIILASIVVLAFGLWDDIHGIRASWKMLGQSLATALLIWQGIMVLFPRILPLNIFITVFWVIGITNAFNFVDSMDGLAAGLGGITATSLMLGAIHGGQDSLALLSAVVLGACIGVFYFNFSLSRLFLGDSGAQLLGFVLAAIAIVYTPPHLPQGSSWFVPILLFSVPIFDTTLVTLSRMRKKLPVYKASRDHTYHRLVGMGMPPLRAVLAMHFAAIVIDCLAFIALSLSPLWANLIFGLILLFGVFAFYKLESVPLGE